MEWLYAAILGLVQGLTEFLPISSSAHLRITGSFLPGGSDPGAAFTAITQLGTETAVLLFFWRDIVRIIKHWCLALVGKMPRNDPDARMGWLIIIGSIPIGVLGLLLEEQIDTTFRSLWIVAFMLVFFGLLLAAADSLGKQRRQLQDLTVKHGIFYGFFQALALIPGVSRSGGTITGGLALGYSREAATRYSFLLAIPAVMISGGYKLAKALKDGFDGPYGAGPTALATVIAFIVGFVVIGWLLRYISTHSFRLFVWYRIALGFILFVLLGLNLIDPTV
ncbi:undecaprenyl-diphosphate phosphatase [Pseudoglutamicibacter albus]|uniref:Undecaprenyl-diphosphatase n=2 Tax=Pseudoglutamicibacter albus TaxID=98671 RepID=A0A095YEP9_9MICC|nr:undecaprenyl-diphosphate phosphatase [Pseudoglutamicibacter albus]KGF20880.1 UDP-diphosphatase [Pseudoglutamicibacter albus DNF00011]MCG7305403.1 undecaprenyl-diphosphate phosphatase [Pseudoglutamicibacter albus]MDR7293449.1 undecaprenyl-diphosphatase [Pseudoglutamicibacter albus]